MAALQKEMNTMRNLGYTVSAHLTEEVFFCDHLVPLFGVRCFDMPRHMKNPA